MTTIVQENTNRRDFLYIATGAVGTVGTVLALWPFVAQMDPSAAVLALATVDVDLSAVAVGQEITVKWRGSPVFIRNRGEKEIEMAKAVKVEELKDQYARNNNLGADAKATDDNRVLGDKTKNEAMLVMVGVCTHLGCVPIPNEGEYAVVEGNVKEGGWYCPCHGSHYDTAGRIRKGPAPENLLVPKYEYLNDTKIRIG